MTARAFIGYDVLLYFLLYIDVLSLSCFKVNLYSFIENLISNNKNIDLFKGIKFIEVVYPKTSEFKEAYLIRINEQGEINLLDIEHYTHKTEESNKSS